MRADMADKYDAELEELLETPVVINFKENSIPSLRGGSLELECRNNLKAKLSALLRRVEVKELEDIYDKRGLYMLNGGSTSVFVVHANQIKDRILELQALLPRSPQEGESDE